MQLPTLAKIKFSDRFIRQRDQPLNELVIRIPTVRFKSDPEWRRTAVNYNLKDGDTVVVVQEQAYNYGRYPYSKRFHILPLIAILTGITKKAAIKWKHCKAYYPSIQMQELTYLDGTPWVTEEQIKKEEAEYDEKMKLHHAKIYGVERNWPAAQVIPNIRIPELPPLPEFQADAVNAPENAQLAMNNGDALEAIPYDEYI